MDRGPVKHVRDEWFSVSEAAAFVGSIHLYRRLSSRRYPCPCPTLTKPSVHIPGSRYHMQGHVSLECSHDHLPLTFRASTGPSYFDYRQYMTADLFRAVSCHIDPYFLIGREYRLTVRINNTQRATFKSEFPINDTYA